jgi:hypothetical protein
VGGGGRVGTVPTPTQAKAYGTGLGDQFETAVRRQYHFQLDGE